MAPRFCGRASTVPDRFCTTLLDVAPGFYRLASAAVHRSRCPYDGAGATDPPKARWRNVVEVSKNKDVASRNAGPIRGTAHPQANLYCRASAVLIRSSPPILAV